MVKKFNELNENIDNELFEKKKNEIIKKANDFLKDYDDFAMIISSSQWRTSGHIYSNMNEIINYLQNMEEGGSKEFKYSMEEDKDFDVNRFRELYPEKYSKYMKELKTKDFNL